MKVKIYYEENFTLLRDLKAGDKYITKANTECIYLKNIGNDKHLVKDVGYDSILIDSKKYIVESGNFPVFKNIRLENTEHQDSTNPTLFIRSVRCSLPLTNQKLWEMAKVIVDKQKAAKKQLTDNVDWKFDWLEEELFSNGT